MTELDNEDWKALYDATHYWNKVGQVVMRELLDEIRYKPEYHNDPDMQCLINRADRWCENKE